MSRSNPPRSNIVEKVRESDRKAGLTTAINRPSLRRKIRIRLAALAMWLHIYVSMFSLAVLLFFSVTGITLNHPGWFFRGSPRRVQAEGQIDLKWLHVDAPAPISRDEFDKTHQIARLEIVEFLRKVHHIRGALEEIKADERECTVTFKGPGYAADAFIDRASGHYQLTETSHGFIAVINDLHKGRDTGPAWSVVIDLSAVLMTTVSATGLVLLFYLKRRRIPGLLIGLVGTAVVVAVFWLWVP
jgi:hypothetical protein